MSDKMSDEDFCNKVQWEGGLFEAMFGYGLKASDLADQDGDLAKAVGKLEALRPQIDEITDEIDTAMGNVGDGRW